MAVDLKIDLETGDLDFTDGLTIEKDETTIAAQRLMLALNINLGEWFANVEFGVPYIKTEESALASSQRYFMGGSKIAIKSYIKTTLDDFIEAREYISELTDSKYEFDSSSRIYTYSYTVKTTDGTSISSSVTTE